VKRRQRRVRQGTTGPAIAAGSPQKRWNDQAARAEEKQTAAPLTIDKRNRLALERAKAVNPPESPPVVPAVPPLALTTFSGPPTVTELGTAVEAVEAKLNEILEHLASVNADGRLAEERGLLAEVVGSLKDAIHMER
jgi:hypothetical protein